MGSTPSKADFYHCLETKKWLVVAEKSAGKDRALHRAIGAAKTLMLYREELPEWCGAPTEMTESEEENSDVAEVKAELKVASHSSSIEE